MTRNPWFVLAVAIAAAILLAGCSTHAASAPAKPAPPEVLVTTVLQQDVAVYGDWVATLEGYVNANIQPQVSGYIVKQNYGEGRFVHKDDVLFEIDPRPFQATLDQTRGQLAQAEGQLGQAQAQLELARINVNRDTPLAAARAIAQSQLDNAVQAQAQSEAQVKTAQANIQAIKAAVQQAELSLSFTKVRSPIDGIAGIATVQMGNLVSPTAVLTTVSQLDPIKVYFPISEHEYLVLVGQMKASNSPDLLRANSRVPLELRLTNDAIYPQKGRIEFADRQVNSQTGTIRMVGAFPNPGNVLRPGQFGRVRAITQIRKGALLVPQRAVSELQGRYQVAVVAPDNKVSIRNVNVGTRTGQLWIVESGLQPGERVVSEGVSKVRDGTVVNPKPDVPQEPSAAPAGGAL